MEMSLEIADLASALAKAQSSIEGAAKDKMNPHFRAKYADLGAVWAACREALTTNGLSVVQAPGLCEDGHVSMVTVLLHSSGQWMRETMSIPLGKVDAQGYGSAISYARRYCLAAMVGVAPEDDDGNAAAKHAPEASNGPAPRTKLDGPHTSKTSLRAAISKLDTVIRAATAADGINDILKGAKATIAQAERDWPELIHGDPSIEEAEGLQKLVQRRRAELAEPEPDGMFAMLIASMKENDNLASLTRWVATNEALIDELDDAERRKFEAARDLLESGLMQVAKLNAG